MVLRSLGVVYLLGDPRRIFLLQWIKSDRWSDLPGIWRKLQQLHRTCFESCKSVQYHLRINLFEFSILDLDFKNTIRRLCVRNESLVSRSWGPLYITVTEIDTFMMANIIEDFFFYSLSLVFSSFSKRLIAHSPCQRFKVPFSSELMKLLISWFHDL